MLCINWQLLTALQLSLSNPPACSGLQKEVPAQHLVLISALKSVLRWEGVICMRARDSCMQGRLF